MKFIVKHDIQTGRASVIEVHLPFPDGFDIFDTRQQAQAVAENPYDYVESFSETTARLSNVH
jgi:hypothetical protein